MSESHKEKLIQELETLRQNCEYNAESHYTSAKKADNLNLYLQIIPALVATITATIAVAFPSTILVALSATGAAVSTVSSILDPKKRYKDFKQAGHLFTILKHEVRRLKDVLSEKLTDDELFEKSNELFERYYETMQMTPLTEENSFMSARKKIHEGLHDPDKKE